MIESIFYPNDLRRTLQKVNKDKRRLRLHIINHRLVVPIHTRPEPDLTLFQPRTEEQAIEQAKRLEKEYTRIAAIQARHKIEDRKYWASVNKKIMQAEEDAARFDCGDAYDKERDEGRIPVKCYGPKPRVY